MTVTDEMRDDAALLCAIMASNDPHEAFYSPCDVVGVDCYADGGAASPILGVDDREWWAEAEAKLRCGWEPKVDRDGVPF